MDWMHQMDHRTGITRLFTVASFSSPLDLSVRIKSLVTVLGRSNNWTHIDQQTTVSDGTTPLHSPPRIFRTPICRKRVRGIPDSAFLDIMVQTSMRKMPLI